MRAAKRRALPQGKLTDDPLLAVCHWAVRCGSILTPGTPTAATPTTATVRVTAVPNLVELPKSGGRFTDGEATRRARLRDRHAGQAEGHRK